MKFNELLEELDACNDAQVWAAEKTIEEVVKTCDKGDWLAWLADKLDLPFELLILFKAKSAKTIMHLMTDQKCINVVNIAEKVGLGKATLEEFHSSFRIAISYDIPSLDRHIITNIYYSTTNFLRVIARVVGSEASIDPKNANHAKAKNLSKTADICREVLGDEIIKEVIKLLNKK